MSNDLAIAKEPNLNIFQIESELAELMEFRENEDLTADERQVVDTQIAEYVSRELTKVDNLRAYMRHCQIMADAAADEVKLQSARAHSWKQRLEYLKGCCLDAMKILKKPRLDGRTGYLLAKGNGGKQALTIYDERLIPDSMCVYEGRIPAWLWPRIVGGCEYYGDTELLRDIEGLRLVRTPIQEAIRAAMDLSCVQCGGLGTQCPAGPSDAPLETCTGCDGTGKTRVPGARLEPRGSHCEIR